MPPRIRLTSLTISRGPIASPRCILILGRVQFNRQFSSTAARYDAELPSAKEEKRSSLAKNFSSRLDHLQAAIFMAGQKINDLTGYSGIEALKKDIEQQEAKLSAAKTAVKDAKIAYKTAIARRSDSQKEVNELLQRKNLWSPADLERFTELYRSDHANEQAEIQAQNRLNEVEKEVDNASSLLSKSILTRYHEEQVWSDKIRRASTWGTWMLMGINIVLFIVVQLGLEPWKRKRLVNNFEEKVKIMLQEEKTMVIMAQAAAPAAPTINTLPDKVPVSDPKVEEILETAPVERPMASVPDVDIREVMEVPTSNSAEDATIPAKISKSFAEKVSETVSGLLSEELVSLRRVDVTTYVIEGFAVGAIVVGTTVSFVLWR
ncbi:hypothetical protein ABW19_dt0205336 [Dactylella cylindrospora]|nr:hypothetical protein ABW19_dt0205336 [Dactylella cylindrospora]